MRIINYVTAFALACAALCAKADYSLNYSGELSAHASTGDFAPYFMASNCGGVVTQGSGAHLRARLWRDTDTTRRFSYGFAADLIGGWSSSVDYERYKDGAWTVNPRRGPGFTVQELWGNVKWRSIYLTVGQTSNKLSLFNPELGSGDLVLSDNARPIPQVRAGFVNFQNIPFTQGWVQIRGNITYGKMTDSRWLENHYNYYNNFLTTGVWFHHKSLHLRTAPGQPFSVTVGMQDAVQFGGTCCRYADGRMYRREEYKVGLKQLLNAFYNFKSSSGFADGDNAYWFGNHIGSWDLRLRYRFRDGSELTAYMQSPWEDGSGIGKLNGWDGVWGLEWQPSEGWLKGAVVEYLDFTNQGGPMHWAPGDVPGSGIPGQATGHDNYYNNYMYNGWANYGMSIGTPFLVSPLYNRSGYMGFLHNCVRGFHIGLLAEPIEGVRCRLLMSYRKSSGTKELPLSRKADDASVMAEAVYAIPGLSGMTVKWQLALDAGSLYGPSFGSLVSLTYKGDITFKRK